MELAPWRSFQVKPMLKFTNHAGAPADTVSAIRRKEIEGSAEATFGAVISRTGRPGYWGNTVVAIRETPSGLIGRTDQNEAIGDENSKTIAKQTNAENAAARNSALRGDSPHYDTTFILTDTANIDFNRWSLMTGLWVEHDIYNSPRNFGNLREVPSFKTTRTKPKRTPECRLEFSLFTTSAIRFTLLSMSTMQCEQKDSRTLMPTELS
jgi:hypothetical protein